MPHDMAEGGGTESATPVPAKRGMGWRLWAVIAVVAILVIAGAAYYLTRGGPSRDTKTLVYYMQSEPLTMDSSDAYDLWSFIAIQNTYDTLVGYKTDSLQLVGVLAQSWDILDAQHYVFHIRHGVKFWDGSNFTANDVYASFRKVIIENSPESGVAWILNQNLDASNIPGSLWVKDTFTIQMNLTVAYAGFLQTLATVEPSAIMSGAWITANGGVQPNTANDFIKHNSMGTAPYYMKASDWVAKDHMTLHKNPYFWRGWTGTEPESVVIRFTNDASSRVEAIRTGAADLADLPLSSVSQVSGLPGVVAKANDTVKSEIVSMNATNAYMADNATGRLVRQAFSYAFDYNATITNDYAGFATLLPGPIPKGMQFFDQESQLYYQNLQKAGALLDQAGYTKNGQGIRFGGYAFRLVADGTQVEEANAARRFQTSLQSIGVQTNLQITQSTDAWDAIRGSGTYDFFVAHWVLDYLDPDDYVTPMVMSAYAYAGDYWHTGFNNTTINNYGNLARSELNNATRAADYHIVWQTSMANPNMIWFCQQQYVPVHQNYVKGFWFNPVTWWNFYFYQKT